LDTTSLDTKILEDSISSVIVDTTKGIAESDENKLISMQRSQNEGIVDDE
jgi:hypothetical protein